MFGAAQQRGRTSGQRYVFITSAGAHPWPRALPPQLGCHRYHQKPAPSFAPPIATPCPPPFPEEDLAYFSRHVLLLLLLLLESADGFVLGSCVQLRLSTCLACKEEDSQAPPTKVLGDAIPSLTWTIVVPWLRPLKALKASEWLKLYRVFACLCCTLFGAGRYAEPSDVRADVSRQICQAECLKLATCFGISHDGTSSCVMFSSRTSPVKFMNCGMTPQLRLRQRLRFVDRCVQLYGSPTGELHAHAT